MLQWFDSTATLFFLDVCERDGMVDMSDLGSGDVSCVGSSPTARRILLEFIMARFFFTWI